MIKKRRQVRLPNKRIGVLGTSYVHQLSDQRIQLDIRWLRCQHYNPDACVELPTADQRLGHAIKMHAPEQFSQSDAQLA